MPVLFALIGAAGMWLCYVGATGPRRSVAQRVTPYVTDRPVGPRRAGQASRLSGPQAVLIRMVSDLGPESREALARRLQAAGSSLGPDDYRLEQLMWAGFMGAVGAVLPTLAWAASLEISWPAVPSLVFIGCMTGYLARDWHLSRQKARRQALYLEELPVAIDLITLSLMAGGSVAAGCKQVAAVMGGGIGDEFRIVWGDVRAGTGVVEALEGLGRRVPHPSMTRFVDALATGIERGAPLADVLRAQADDARDARRRALLEIGGRREVLMLVPVVFLILPVVVMFALWPGLVTLDLLVP